MKNSPPPERLRPALAEDIKNTPLFQGVADEVIETLVPSSYICKVERDEDLFPMRQDGKYLYVIRKGYFSLRVPAEVLEWDDNFLAWRGPGQILGEFALLFSELQGGKLREIDDFKLLGAIGKLRATEVCELLEIEGVSFVSAASNDSNIYRNISRLLIKKMVEAGSRSEAIQLPKVKKQVIKTLLALVEERGYRPGEKKIIRGRIVQRDIAGYIGARRESVNEQFLELRKEKLIAYTKESDGEIEILDERGLRDKFEQYQ